MRKRQSNSRSPVHDRQQLPRPCLCSGKRCDWSFWPLTLPSPNVCVCAAHKSGAQRQQMGPCCALVNESNQCEELSQCTFVLCSLRAEQLPSSISQEGTLERGTLEKSMVLQMFRKPGRRAPPRRHNHEGQLLLRKSTPIDVHDLTTRPLSSKLMLKVDSWTGSPEGGGTAGTHEVSSGVLGEAVPTAATLSDDFGICPNSAIVVDGPTTTSLDRNEPLPLFEDLKPSGRTLAIDMGARLPFPTRFAFSSLKLFSRCISLIPIEVPSGNLNRSASRITWEIFVNLRLTTSDMSAPSVTLKTPWLPQNLHKQLLVLRAIACEICVWMWRKSPRSATCLLPVGKASTPSELWVPSLQLVSR